jgi:hypothetical protein
MKTIQKLSICLIALCAIGGQVCVAQEPEQTYQEPETEVADNGVREALNDIRFAGWTSKEWADNEYIRTFRKYLDAYNSGKIEDARLDEYKDYIKGKFVIADIEPYIVGGAYISIIFYDNPDKIFSAVVYSDVNIKTRKVSNYEFRSMDLTLTGYDVTQEEIHQFLEERPEHRLW